MTMASITQFATHVEPIVSILLSLPPTSTTNMLFYSNIKDMSHGSNIKDMLHGTVNSKSSPRTQQM